jgi:flagellar hook-basal body complex protein FliE
MAISPSVAAAAYQSIARMGGEASAATGAVPSTGSFSDFLGDAVRDGIKTMKTGEQMATGANAGQSNIVDVVNAVNSAELTLDTVVAVRDKVVQAYQSIMNMPI